MPNLLHKMYGIVCDIFAVNMYIDTVDVYERKAQHMRAYINILVLFS